MNASKPWYKSTTLVGVAITAVGHFSLKLSHHFPEFVHDMLVFAGLGVSFVGRIVAEKRIGV